MILQGKMPASEELVNIEVEEGSITRVGPSRGQMVPDYGGPGSFVCPGFFDPQVNGFGGVDFNGKELTRECLRRAALVLASSGVTAFFPTLTTADAGKTIARLRVLSRAMEEDPLGGKWLPGFIWRAPIFLWRRDFEGPIRRNIFARRDGRNSNSSRRKPRVKSACSPWPRRRKEPFLLSRKP